jgi:hypothetical protein
MLIFIPKEQGGKLPNINMKYNIITQVLNIEISLHFHNQNESTPTNTPRKMDRKWSINTFY